MIGAEETAKIDGLPIHIPIVHDNDYGLNNTSTLETCFVPGSLPLLS